MKRVFISYRRHDSKYQARMIYAAFEQAVARNNVFMDVDSIPPGSNFRKILKGWVDECEVLLALIGPGWIDAADPATGQRRLDNPSDFVRIEISEALARDIPVVPVLLDGAPLPRPDQLPPDLAELCDRQAEFVEYRTFDADVARLIAKLGLGDTPMAEARQRAEQTRIDRELTAQEERYRAEGRIQITVGNGGNDQSAWGKPGAGKTEWFKDLDIGPEMVMVPGASGIVPFAIGRFALTFAEWDAAQAHPEWRKQAKIEPRKPNDHGWGRGRQPVICVSWDDAKAYCAWLSAVTAKTYRLPSDTEWEHACRAGTATAYWWGNEISTAQANYQGWVFGKGGESRRRTVPVHSFDPNPWGLYQVHGNVFEWCEDLFDPPARMVRGGCWNEGPGYAHSSHRFRYDPVDRNCFVGFRVARTL